MEKVPIHPNASLRSINPSVAATREVAQKLEAVFLSEMLKGSVSSSSERDLAGGIGEEQFSSFLRNAQADLIASKGGLGLAELIHRSLTDAKNAP